MANRDRRGRIARQTGEEFEEYVKRLERERLRQVGEFKEELGEALDVAAEHAEEESDKEQAVVAARAMRAAAKEFKDAVKRMENRERDG